MFVATNVFVATNTSISREKKKEKKMFVAIKLILVATPANDNKVVLYCVHTPYTPGNTALGVTMKRPGMSAAIMTPWEYDDVTLV